MSHLGYILYPQIARGMYNASWATTGSLLIQGWSVLMQSVISMHMMMSMKMTDTKYYIYDPC